MYFKESFQRREFLKRGGALAAVLSTAPAGAQYNGDPGEPNPHTQPAPNRRDIIIYRDPFAYCSHASIVRLANGEWVTAFNECQKITPYTHPPGDPHFHNLISRSDDEGRTWSPPEAAPNWDWYGVECPGLAQLQDGTVVLNQWQFLWYPLALGRKLASQGQKIWLRTSRKKGWLPAASDSDFDRSLYPWARANSGCFVHLSSDGGRTWDRTVRIPTEPYIGGYTPRGVAQLQDGTVLMVTADHPLNHTAYAVRSRDGGLTWTPPVAVANAGEGMLSEPTAAVLPSGKVVTMMRSHTRYLHQSESSDGGSTWTPVRKTPIFGYPGHLLRLSDGRLLVTYGHRRSPFGIRACQSRDNGRTWDYGQEYLIRGDLPNRNLGYPVTIEYRPGHLFTIYYGEEPDGVTSIQGSYWEIPS